MRVEVKEQQNVKSGKLLTLCYVGSTEAAKTLNIEEQNIEQVHTAISKLLENFKRLNIKAEQGQILEAAWKEFINLKK